MDVGLPPVLVKACLCLGFLFGLLRWRTKMGYNARLEAMQSHSAAQKRKRQRLPFPEIGLSSLCSLEGLASQTSTGCRSTLESRFYAEKESLSRFASSPSPSVIHRNSLFRPASKFLSTNNGASLYDSPRLAHPGSHTSDEHTSWRRKEASYSNDTHSEDSGWHLVSRRHSLKTLSPSGCSFESVATEAGAEHQSMSFGHRPGSSSQSMAAPVGALSMLHRSWVKNVNTFHPPADAFFSSANSSLPAISEEMSAAASLIFLSEPRGHMDVLSAAAGALHQGPRDLPIMTWTDYAPVAASSWPERFNADKKQEVVKSEPVYKKFQDSRALWDSRLKNMQPEIADKKFHLESLQSEAVYNKKLLQDGRALRDSSLKNMQPEIADKKFHPESLPSEAVYKKLLQDSALRDTTLKDLQSEIAAKKLRLESLQRTRKDFYSTKKQASFVDEEIPTSVAFTPLSKEEEEEVHEALNGANRHQVLVLHEPSNIDLSRAALQCLKPGAWLNDEVINLYMDLLKEREQREPKDYLKCHFFNTFFFNKLYKDACSYNFKAVRRWTTQKKLGYSLLDCDKIFVPIHKDIHWCLAVINIREKKLQYLDSLKGHDGNALQVLAKYIKDEAKDKGDKDLDMGSWDLEFLKDIPEQMNGCDCGMFMIKYADFLSRGNELKFTQENMEYFRKRTTLELLQLKAS